MFVVLLFIYPNCFNEALSIEIFTNRQTEISNSQLGDNNQPVAAAKCYKNLNKQNSSRRQMDERLTVNIIYSANLQMPT